MVVTEELFKSEEEIGLPKTATVVVITGVAAAASIWATKLSLSKLAKLPPSSATKVMLLRAEYAAMPALRTSATRSTIGSPLLVIVTVLTVTALLISVCNWATVLLVW